MELSKAVALVALVLMLALSAGHAQAQAKKKTAKPPKVCIIKPVMTDSEIDSCKQPAYFSKSKRKRIPYYSDT